MKNVSLAEFLNVSKGTSIRGEVHSLNSITEQISNHYEKKKSSSVHEKDLAYRECSRQEWPGICSEGRTLCLALGLICLCTCASVHGNASLYEPQLTVKNGCSPCCFDSSRECRVLSRPN